MLIEQIVKEKIAGITAVNTAVGGRIYLQSNDESKNDFKLSLPLITYIPLTETFKANSKAVTPFQVTVRANTYLEAATISGQIREAVHGVPYEHYKEARVRGSNRIYDPVAKAVGVALTIDFIYQYSL